MVGERRNIFGMMRRRRVRRVVREEVIIWLWGGGGWRDGRERYGLEAWWTGRG
jgi:hypothetical protein